MLKDTWKFIWTVSKTGDEGARILSEMLKTNTTLTKLDLTCDNQTNN